MNCGEDLLGVPGLDLKNALLLKEAIEYWFVQSSVVAGVDMKVGESAAKKPRASIAYVQ